MAVVRASGIFWEASDRTAIIKHGCAFVRTKGIKVPFERGAILLEVVEYAQRQALDRKFHRPLTNSTTYQWVEDGIIELMKQPVEEDTPVDNATLDLLMPISSLVLTEDEKKEIEKKLRDTNSSVWNMIQEEVRKTPVIVSLVDSLAEMLADDILVAVQKRLAQHQHKLVVPPSPAPEVKNPEVSVKKEKPQLKVVAKAKKHVVCLVGLLPDQFSMMEQEFGGRLDMRHIGSDDVRKSEIMDTANMVFAMIKFLNHGTTNKIQKRANNYQFVNGGLSDLRAKINKYIVDHQITA